MPITCHYSPGPTEYGGAWWPSGWWDPRGSTKTGLSPPWGDSPVPSAPLVSSLVSLPFASPSNLVAPLQLHLMLMWSGAALVSGPCFVRIFDERSPALLCLLGPGSCSPPLAAGSLSPSFSPAWVATCSDLSFPSPPACLSA